MASPAEGNRYAIGIDLGTSFCCVATLNRAGVVEIIPNDMGHRITPSYVAFGETRLVGEAARTFYKRNPASTLYEIKRLIGRKFTEDSVSKDAARWPFKVIRGSKGEVVLSVQGVEKEFTPEEISAHLLIHLRDLAQKFLTTEEVPVVITDAVITVPAYFNDSQRQATQDAGKIAGLNVLELMNEPTAAALGFAYQKMFKEANRTVLVFDLGGGTFDVSIMTINGYNFEVKALAGDTHLGGVDLDGRLMEYVVSEYLNRYPNSKINANDKLLRRIREACILAKIDLSARMSTSVLIEEGDREFEVEVTRAKFEDINMDLFDRCTECVERALIDADLRKTDITDVVLVGGSSRIPVLRDMLKKVMGKEPLSCVHPDEAVAYGAAVQAALKLATTTEVKKEELVCKCDELREVKLVDVVPLSIGVDLNNGRMRVLIPKNSKRPKSGMCTLCTARDNQTSMLFPVYQGEEEFAADNDFLGSFTLSGFEPAPRGYAIAEVTFSVDENGILHCTARALSRNAPGRTSEVTIVTDKGRLSEEQMGDIVMSMEKYMRLDVERDEREKAEYNRNRCRLPGRASSFGA